MEKVTDPKQKVKDPKKVAAGRAGAAARKAKLLEQLRAAKESFRPPAGGGTSANIHPKEADQEQAVSGDKRRENSHEGLTNWTRRPLGFVLRAGRSCFFETRKQEVPRRRRQAPLTPRPSSLWMPPGAKQLKTTPDPFYTE